MPQTNSLDFSSPAAADKALKLVGQLMTRAGQSVVSSEFSDKPRRTAGVTYREANLTLASGQQVTLRVNGTGDIYQVLLNNQVKPLKEHTDTQKAVAEIATLAEKGQAAFQKAQARRSVALPKGMSTPRPKIADALRQQLADLDTQIAEKQATVQDLKAKLGTAAITDSAPALAPLSGDQGPEPTSWLDFKLVNQAFVDKAGPLPLPSRFQVGEEVLLWLGHTKLVAKVIGANFRASKVHYTLAVPAQAESDEPMYAVLYDVDSVFVATPADLQLDSANLPPALASLEQFKSPESASMLDGLSTLALDVLAQLAAAEGQAVADGDLVSKDGRDTLLELALIDRYTEAGDNVLNDKGRESIALLDSISSVVDHEPAPLPLASAFVAACAVVVTDGALLDSANAAGAVGYLQIALDIMETNFPINMAEGNIAQARLEAQNAASFRAAIAMLDSAAPASGSTLEQLLLIAQSDVIDEDGIVNQEALATALKDGLVEASEGLFFLTEKGKQHLNGEGFDAYGKPLGPVDCP